MPPAFCHEENLAALSGYLSNNKNIKAINPPGFFAPNFLFDQLSKNIIGYRQVRSGHLSFRGVRTTRIEGKGSTELTGFYQRNFTEDDELLALVSEREGQEIGRSGINPATGLFKISLSEPSINGIMKIERKGSLIYSKNYALLQGITGTVNFVEKTFTDAYGREFQLDGSAIVRPEKLKPSSWYGPIYADERTGNINLSDRFKGLLDYLGPRVLIADPYFIGEFRRDDTNSDIKLSRCQIAFLAALLRSIIDGSVSEVYILGFNTRANSVERKGNSMNPTKTENRFKQYKEVLDHIWGKNKLKTFKSEFRMEFLNNKRDFHNRYWFGLTIDNGIRDLNKCVVVTNSVGNISEVDFYPVEEEGQLRELTARFLDFFNNCDSELIV
ncbi:hypothetical protein GCM10011511_01420 [Puia dinghuensis]|uniref:Uncharacterized protein n=2 Tax=Puia dinghuensis TaxID=1792502 RepID=A0A8J2XQB1_9BACT|nr:hypothetical protein GCM10011511_01420 [Puia dinghuensis]